mmetsp:Transcript_28339/g.90660  ORF Transcript_28339/g.90660 Transcript_28339/m.90660 type:complete len:442 (-) Transcript_28339:81-1406(-)
MRQIHVEVRVRREESALGARAVVSATDGVPVGAVALALGAAGAEPEGVGDEPRHGLRGGCRVVAAHVGLRQRAREEPGRHLRGALRRHRGPAEGVRAPLARARLAPLGGAEVAHGLAQPLADHGPLPAEAHGEAHEPRDGEGVLRPPRLPLQAQHAEFERHAVHGLDGRVHAAAVRVDEGERVDAAAGAATGVAAIVLEIAARERHPAHLAAERVHVHRRLPEDLREPAGGHAPQALHVPEPVLRVAEAERRREVLHVGALDVRHAPGVAADLDVRGEALQLHVRVQVWQRLVRPGRRDERAQHQLERRLHLDRIVLGLRRDPRPGAPEAPGAGRPREPPLPSITGLGRDSPRHLATRSQLSRPRSLRGRLASATQGGGPRTGAAEGPLAEGDPTPSLRRRRGCRRSCPPRMRRRMPRTRARRRVPAQRGGGSSARRRWTP